jgi:hypothetical protein
MAPHALTFHQCFSFTCVLSGLLTSLRSAWVSYILVFYKGSSYMYLRSVRVPQILVFYQGFSHTCVSIRFPHILVGTPSDYSHISIL